MAKKTVIQDRVKIRGIRKRWLVNSMGVVTLILLLAMGTLTLSLWAYYEGSMRDNLSSRASDTARSFSVYTRREYRTAAQDYVAKFPDKQKLEVQFIETDGSLLCTSYGLTTSGTMPGTPDITGAMESGDVKPWTGQDPQTGERIMAVSAPIIYQGTTVGVIRFVTSMAAVDRQLFLSIGVCTLIGIAILTMVYFSNLYFVRSIVEPLASINETARLIADGSYGIQIEKKFDDEIGELTDTINDMSLKIKQSEKTQSEFISSVSHELRTPLTAITGWAETIQSGELKDPGDVRKGMDIIVSEAHRLTNMVEELLEFSKMQDGRFTLRIEDVDLQTEFEDAVYTYQELFRQDGIHLEYDDDGELYADPIPGDPERLKQVLCNVLDNAAKHGGSGKRIIASLRRDADNYVIRIRDFGPGIPPAELPYVKQKFYKGSSKARGSGIGLAVCDEIITRHGGTFEIGNADGGGALVTITLPIPPHTEH